MKIRSLLAVAAVTATLAGVTATTAAATPALSSHGHPRNVADVCAHAAPGHARCFAQVRTDVAGGPAGVRGPGHPGLSPAAAALPAGLGPADLHAAYKLPATGGANQTIAIIDAGDDATAEADLAVYRSTYGLPACTTANGCFRKLNQHGASAPLPPDQGWGVEIALDLDMASATCPGCKIVLVEGDDATVGDLAASVDTAVAAGATVVSNSYGADEYNGAAAFASHYAHPGVAIVASSGDSGYRAPSVPAAYQSVVAVGGTTLTKAGTARGWSETAWSGAGSGCSAWFAKPAWQTDPNCPGRVTADVSAVADPNTGVAVYLTGYRGGQWGIVGGTSASAPIIAGVIALAGHPERFADAGYLYAHAAGLNDVVGGNNAISGMDCGGDYQCNAVPGYDGPTGLGTPNGLGAF